MNLELLKTMCSIKGATSEEGKIANFILEEIKDYIDDYEIDALGNLIAHKKGEGKKFMLAGHMDQIGMMVTYIDKDGLLYFVNVGGLNPHVILNCRVVFDDGTIGVVGKNPKAEFSKLKINDLHIDIGATTREEVEKHINIGDIAVYCEEPVYDDYKFTSSYLDDRIGCFFMIEALKQLKKSPYDLYFVFTVQEEIGAFGAKVAGNKINPDYALAFDITSEFSLPDSEKLPQKFGKGACIKLKDASLICSSKIVNHLKKCANDGGIEYQLEILSAGGTDAGAIQRTNHGVHAGGISIATRYVHSMNEMVKINDIKSCIELTLKVIETEM